MKTTSLSILIVLTLLAAPVLCAQRPPEPPPHANHGRIPPPPQARHEQSVRPEGEPREQGHMDHGFPHGRFERFGPGYRYNIVRIDHDHHRFWLPGGFFFEVAAWDWPICADWCWDCGATMSSTRIPTISAGTCSTTHRLEPTCTSPVWARNQSSAQTNNPVQRKSPTLLLRVGLQVSESAAFSFPA